MEISELLVALRAIFAAAKLFGELAERIGQPAVLGEMVGGIVIGVSGLHWIDAHDPLLHAGDRLSADELLAMCFLLLIAGHETTVNL
jgi:Kef-type K+ transport system membrane component KefB